MLYTHANTRVGYFRPTLYMAAMKYTNIENSICRSTSQAVLLSLVVSLVSSRLYYGYETLAGLPGNQIVDRLVCDERRCTTCLLCPKYEHITPLLRDLHWLRVPERIEFKLSVLVFRCLHGTAPPLASELRRVADVDTQKRLRSSSTSALCHTIFVSYDDW